MRNLIEDGLYRMACSRAYYAAFLMTTAVLLTLDVMRTKKRPPPRRWLANAWPTPSISSPG
ncbi:MAG: HEPN domain-containing protein [Vicinamibacterales bacterium]